MPERTEQVATQERLGRVLRDLRKARGVAQDQVGTVPQYYVSEIEHGARNPSWSVVVRILDALDVSVEEFGARWDATP